eukprot:scaffold7505_cov807-Prasinococcus_capsulatus_cf.AAC.1
MVESGGQGKERKFMFATSSDLIIPVPPPPSLPPPVPSSPSPSSPSSPPPSNAQPTCPAAATDCSELTFDPDDGVVLVYNNLGGEGPDQYTGEPPLTPRSSLACLSNTPLVPDLVGCRRRRHRHR